MAKTKDYNLQQIAQMAIVNVKCKWFKFKINYILIVDGR